MIIYNIISYFSEIQLLNIFFSLWTLINVISEVYYRKRSGRDVRAPLTRLYIIFIWLIGSTILMSFNITFINYAFIGITIYLWVYKYILSLMSAEEFDGEQSHLRTILEKLGPILENYIINNFKKLGNFLEKDKTNNNENQNEKDEKE